MTGHPIVGGDCWMCGHRHTGDEFPIVNRIPITYGYMAIPCRDRFNALPMVQRQQIRARGIARWEEIHA